MKLHKNIRHILRYFSHLMMCRRLKKVWPTVGCSPGHRQLGFFWTEVYINFNVHCRQPPPFNNYCHLTKSLDYPPPPPLPFVPWLNWTPVEISCFSFIRLQSIWPVIPALLPDSVLVVSELPSKSYKVVKTIAIGIKVTGVRDLGAYSTKVVCHGSRSLIFHSSCLDVPLVTGLCGSLL